MFSEILQIRWRFFLFWRNLKKEAATAILIMYIIYIINRAFLALEPPKIRIMTKNFNAMLTKPRWIIWHHFWVDLGGIEITCTWVKMGRNSGPKISHENYGPESLTWQIPRDRKQDRFETKNIKIVTIYNPPP